MSRIKTSPSRENILGKIRKALSAHALSMPFPDVEKQNVADAFESMQLSMEETFAAQFIGLGGKYVYCANEQELLQNINDLYESRAWQKLFCADERLLQICSNNKLNFVQSSNNTDDSADACITSCEAMIARTGSFLISSRQHDGRVSTVFHPIHIVVAYHQQTVYDILDGFKLIEQKYPQNSPSMISLQTGPSRTADIEKTLVTGVHGPKEVFCFYVNA
jgi:L-lactate dehydrogenase complex protein LldG